MTTTVESGGAATGDVAEVAHDPAGPEHRRGRDWVRPFGVGALVAGASTAAGSLVAAIASVDSPVASVAGVVIDNVPNPIRRWAIRTFGTHDKFVLGIGILVVVAVVATVVARAAATRRWVVLTAIVGFAAVGLGAAERIGPGVLLSAFASVVAAWVVFAVLLPHLPRPASSVGPGPDTVTFSIDVAPAAVPMVVHRWDAAVDRREFTLKAGALWAGTAIVGSVAAAINRAESASVTRARAQFPEIPPGSPNAAPTVPGAASVGNGAVPYITPTKDFYRIDTAFLAPRVSLDDWRLEITGAVDRPLTLTYDELLDRHIVERIVTLACVSNTVGGELVGNATFLGVPLAELLDEVGVDPAAGSQVAMTSVDGWTCGFPTELALDGRNAIVAIGMNGEPLTVEHGFPVRMVVPGLYGYVSATKWLQRIELVGWDEFDGYWVPLGWSKDGPIKTQSRIDVPRSGADVPVGPVVIAGVAWAQHRGIAKVEVRVDDGEWVEADLGDEVTVDAWRQWIHRWDAEPGEHRISVRATDHDGETQTAERSAPAPDGATGHHTIVVRVAP